MLYNISDLFEEANTPHNTATRLYSSIGEKYREALRKVFEQVAFDFQMVGVEDIDTLRKDRPLSEEATKLLMEAQEVRRDTIERHILGEVPET